MNTFRGIEQSILAKIGGQSLDSRDFIGKHGRSSYERIESMENYPMKRIVIILLALLVSVACTRTETPVEKKQPEAKAQAKAPAAEKVKDVSSLKPLSKKTLVWGMPVKGLSANITMAKDQYKVGDPIPVIYTKMNVSMDQDIDVWDAGFWPNHKIFVRDKDGNDVDPTAKGEKLAKAFAPGGDRDKNLKATIGPRMTRSPLERYNLQELFKLDTPGTYSVQIVYEEYKGGWEGRLWSNPYKFTVSK